MMMTSSKVFLDTGILLRATLSTVPLHTEAQQLVLSWRRRDAELWISRQVLREFIVNITRPQSWTNPLPDEQVLRLVSTIQDLYRIADDTALVTVHLLDLFKQIPTGGKQIHDANIVATMLAYNIEVLLTHNVEDMKRFKEKITVVPLVEP